MNAWGGYSAEVEIYLESKDGNRTRVASIYGEECFLFNPEEAPHGDVDLVIVIDGWRIVRPAKVHSTSDSYVNLKFKEGK